MLALTTVIVACSASKQHHDGVMDRIETQLKLPVGARPLDQYDRFYAAGDHRRVIGVYLAVGKASRKGRRQWFDDASDLPFIDGGGCAEINVTFDRSKQTVTSVACNAIREPSADGARS